MCKREERKGELNRGREDGYMVEGVYRVGGGGSVNLKGMEKVRRDGMCSEKEEDKKYLGCILGK